LRDFGGDFGACAPGRPGAYWFGFLQHHAKNSGFRSLLQDLESDADGGNVFWGVRIRAQASVESCGVVAQFKPTTNLPSFS
jgi:hypothetical protein